MAGAFSARTSWSIGCKFAAPHMSAYGRFCCKSFFALVIKISFGCTRDFRVNMWGTSSPGDKLTGDLANEPDATSIIDRGLFCLLAGNLSLGVFRLLQQNRHEAAVPPVSSNFRC
jgi:hypothetical protein